MIDVAYFHAEQLTIFFFLYIFYLTARVTALGRLLKINCGIIFSLIHNKMSVPAHLLPQNADCFVISLPSCSGSVAIQDRSLMLSRRNNNKVYTYTSLHYCGLSTCALITFVNSVVLWQLSCAVAGFGSLGRVDNSCTTGLM